jgi:hypothetical protein
VIDELDDEPRLSAEDAIRAAREGSCSRGVPADDADAQAG